MGAPTSSGRTSLWRRRTSPSISASSIYPSWRAGRVQPVGFHGPTRRPSSSSSSRSWDDELADSRSEVANELHGRRSAGRPIFAIIVGAACGLCGARGEGSSGPGSLAARNGAAAAMGSEPSAEGLLLAGPQRSTPPTTCLLTFAFAFISLRSSYRGAKPSRLARRL
jgi:hypothetical protein